MKSTGNLDLVAAAAAEVALEDGAPVRKVKLLPIGEIRLRDGRGPYRIRDRAHAEQVVAATKAYLGTLDFNFDYGHSEVARAKGLPADGEAAGWAAQDGLTVEDDGIYASVDWTEDASAKLAARKFRYLSPWFTAAPAEKGGDVIHLKNAALVNIGAIDLPAVAAGISTEKENDDMDLTAIAAALGLAATASVEEIAAAITELKKAKPDTSAIAVAAGLAATASVEEVAAAVTGLAASQGKVDPAKYVPIEQLDVVNGQLKTLLGERADQVVAAAMESGKLAPAMKDWAADYFKKDEAGFRQWLEKAPVVVAAGAALGQHQPGEKFTSLSAEEIAACAALGMSHEDYLKGKNEEVA